MDCVGRAEGRAEGRALAGSSEIMKPSQDVCTAGLADAKARGAGAVPALAGRQPPKDSFAKLLDAKLLGAAADAYAGGAANPGEAVLS